MRAAVDSRGNRSPADNGLPTETDCRAAAFDVAPVRACPERLHSRTFYVVRDGLYALSLTIFASQDSRIYCDGSGQDDFGGVLRVATAVGEVPTGL